MPDLDLIKQGEQGVRQLHNSAFRHHLSVTFAGLAAFPYAANQTSSLSANKLALPPAAVVSIEWVRSVAKRWR
jgi:hypothetical protein